MRELIVAGVRAGFRNWWPWKWFDAVLLLPIVNAANFLSRPEHVRISLKPLLAISLPLFVVAITGFLYARQFEQKEQDGRQLGRLLAAWLLAALFFTVLGLLFFVVLLSTLYAVASAGRGFDPAQVSTWAPAIDERGRIVASAVFILGLLALGWAAMRVWLASATTIAEHRVAMLSTWPFTRHRVLPMAIARAILSLPAALLLTPVIRFVHDGSFATSLVALILSLAWLPLQVGAAAEFYRRRVLPPGSTR